MRRKIDSRSARSKRLHTIKLARLLNDFENSVDAQALGLTEMIEIPFNPLGVSSYRRGRDLSSKTAAEAEAYYATLRAAYQ